MNSYPNITRFLLQEEIAHGIYSTVYKGLDIMTKKQVAIKKLISSGTLDMETKDEFEREIHTMTKLLAFKHPNIIELIDYRIHDDNAYIITKLYKGGSLKAYLAANNKKLPEAKGLFIIKQIANTFVNLANNIKTGEQLLHGDIRLENILFADDDHKHIVLSGFKLSKLPLMTDHPKLPTAKTGVLTHMSPQVLESSYFTNKCDVYSSGMILYECLFGSTLTIQEVKLMQEYKKPSLGSAWDTITPETKHLILGMLAIEEKDRLSWKEVLAHPAMSNIVLPLYNKDLSIEQLHEKIEYLEEKLQIANEKEKSYLDIITKLKNNVANSQLYGTKQSNENNEYGNYQSISIAHPIKDNYEKNINEIKQHSEEGEYGLSSQNNDQQVNEKVFYGSGLISQDKIKKDNNNSMGISSTNDEDPTLKSTKFRENAHKYLPCNSRNNKAVKRHHSAEPIRHTTSLTPIETENEAFQENIQSLPDLSEKNLVSLQICGKEDVDQITENMNLQFEDEDWQTKVYKILQLLGIKIDKLIISTSELDLTLLIQQIIQMKNLKELIIDASGDSKVTDAILNQISSMLIIQKHLTTFHMSLFNVYCISDLGIIGLFKAFREVTSLSILSLDLVGKTMTESSLRELGQSLLSLSSLSTISLSITGNTTLTSSNFRHISNAISTLKSLTTLHLSFSYDFHLNDDTFKEICHAISKVPSLLTLDLNLINTEKITDESVHILSQAINNSSNLTILNLTLANMKHITDRSIQFIAYTILNSKYLSNLELSFIRCSLTQIGNDILQDIKNKFQGTCQINY